MMASSAPTAELGDLNADVVGEILVRLPCASVARCRAVCRAWRGITSSPGFVADYSRRRPLELVVQRHGTNGVLDTVPLATLDEASRRCLDPGYPSGGDHEYTLLASCGDLLLFERQDRRGAGRCLCVCNPVTRQWSAVEPPHQHGLALACGLYLHRPSGEHRLLFLANNTWSDIRGPASHYVVEMDVDAAQTAATTYRYRRLGPPALATVYVISPLAIATHCLDYDGKLHWLDHPEVSDTDKILAFDTVSETFRRTMPRPPALLGCLFQLLEMHGRLAVAADAPDDGSSKRMDLWVLEDYDSDDAGSWTCRHRIDLSALWSTTTTVLYHPHPCCWAMDASALLGYNHNNVIVLGDVASLSALLYHVTEKKVLKQIQVVVANKAWPRTYMSPHVFRNSLPHSSSSM